MRDQVRTPAGTALSSASIEGDSAHDVPSTLYLTVGSQCSLVEIWWASADRKWLPTRCLRWRPPVASADQECALPLDWLPHWNPADVRYLRVMFRTPGPIAVSAPRLLR
jgi:hypothetical protein